MCRKESKASRIRAQAGRSEGMSKRNDVLMTKMKGMFQLYKYQKILPASVWPICAKQKVGDDEKAAELNENVEADWFKSTVVETKGTGRNPFCFQDMMVFKEMENYIDGAPL